MEQPMGDAFTSSQDYDRHSMALLWTESVADSSLSCLMQPTQSSLGSRAGESTGTNTTSTSERSLEDADSGASHADDEGEPDELAYRRQSYVTTRSDASDGSACLDPTARVHGSMAALSLLADIKTPSGSLGSGAQTSQALSSSTPNRKSNCMGSLAIPEDEPVCIPEPATNLVRSVSAWPSYGSTTSSPFGQIHAVRSPGASAAFDAKMLTDHSNELAAAFSDRERVLWPAPREAAHSSPQRMRHSPSLGSLELMATSIDREQRGHSRDQHEITRRSSSTNLYLPGDNEEARRRRSCQNV